MWKLRWNSNFPHKNVNRFETIFVLCVYDGGGPVLYLAGWAELGSVFGVDLWDRCVSGRGHHFFFSSVEIVETFFCFGGAKVFIRQMKRLVRKKWLRARWMSRQNESKISSFEFIAVFNFLEINYKFCDLSRIFIKNCN